MAKETQLGRNRTGIDASPMKRGEMLEGSERMMPATEGSEEAAAQVRSDYIREADPIGSVPLPGTAKGALESGTQMLTGNRPQVLLDKLGERLAYERTGVRLYEALITKCSVRAEAEGVVELDELLHIRDEEARHFELLRQTVEDMGADPTAQTPAADVSAVASSGLLQVINDPRTTVAQSIQALLVVELADNAAWELLISLARDTGNDGLANDFEQALETEERHLAQVKSWLEHLVAADSKVLTP
jgi:ferritin-like protein